MTHARRRALVLAVVGLSVLALGGLSRGQGAVGDDRTVVVLEVPGASLDRLLELPALRGLASAGGSGLLVGGYEPLPGAVDQAIARIPHLPAGAVQEAIVRAVSAPPTRELLVIVVGVEPAAQAVELRDQTLPIVVACCDARDLLDAVAGGGPSDVGSLDALTSDSTRRSGLVVSADVAATAAGFLDLEVPTAGEEIRVVAGPPPFELHERYLAHRRMTVPVGSAAAIFLTIAGLGAVAVLRAGDRAPIGLRRVFAWACLSVAMLATALLAAGHLPRITYAAVVPFVALVTVFGTLAFAPLERRGASAVPAGIGVAVLSFFALEMALGWPAALTPFVGGSQLDGGRSYGLPNAFVGLLIGASLWVAHRLRTTRGFALICVVAMGAGLPYMGSNLGGAVSLFVAAGLWLAVRERERLGRWRALGSVVAVTLAGTLVVLLAHAVSPVATHITRFQRQTEGFRDVLRELADRLQVGADLIARNPLALIPVAGLPIVAWIVLHPPGPVRPSLEADPAWRDALLVIVLAGFVAYLANDSGPAAAGFAFGLGLGGLLGVSLLVPAGKMGGP